MALKFLKSMVRQFVSPPPPPPQEERTLSPELLAKIRAIQVRASHLANDLMAGEYVTAFKGRGVEFTEVREYLPGDDIRLIDWNVTARMGLPYIKEFREERELTVMLMVDVSSSGEFGSGSHLKNEVAAEVASVLAYLAIKNNDKIGLIVFSDCIEKYVPPQKGRAHVWNIIRTILNFNPEGKHTDLNLPLKTLINIQKKRAVVFMISDFQAENYETSLRLARQKHDIIAISITDPRELEFPSIGLIHLQDTETGERLVVDTCDTEFLQEFAEQNRSELENRKRFFRTIGVDLIEINTCDSLVKPILAYFKLRERRH